MRVSAFSVLSKESESLNCLVEWSGWATSIAKQLYNKPSSSRVHSFVADFRRYLTYDPLPYTATFLVTSDILTSCLHQPPPQEFNWNKSFMQTSHYTLRMRRAECSNFNNLVAACPQLSSCLSEE